MNQQRPRGVRPVLLLVVYGVFLVVVGVTATLQTGLLSLHFSTAAMNATVAADAAIVRTFANGELTASDLEPSSGAPGAETERPRERPRSSSRISRPSRPARVSSGSTSVARPARSSCRRNRAYAARSCESVTRSPQRLPARRTPGSSTPASPRTRHRCHRRSPGAAGVSPADRHERVDGCDRRGLARRCADRRRPGSRPGADARRHPGGRRGGRAAPLSRLPRRARADRPPDGGAPRGHAPRPADRDAEPRRHGR